MKNLFFATLSIVWLFYIILNLGLMTFGLCQGIAPQLMTYKYQERNLDTIAPGYKIGYWLAQRKNTHEK